MPTLDLNPVGTVVLNALDLPTLLLWDAKDRLTPTAHAVELASCMPGAKSVTFAGLGRVPMEETPERAFADLHAFPGTSATERPMGEGAHHSPA